MSFESRNSLRWSLAMLMAALSGGLMAQEARIIKFSFEPGENISFVEKLTSTKEKTMGDKGTQLDESIVTSKITITRTESGWNILVEPESVSMKRNGEIINNPIVNLLSSAVVTYKVDAEGNIVDVNGYELLIEGISKQVPPKVFEQLSRIVNVEVMKAKAFAEWKGRFGDFAGAEVEVGDSLAGSMPYQIPNGLTINYNMETKISAIEPCGKTRCVRIDQVYDSRADELARTSGEMVGNIVKAIDAEAPASNPESNSASIRGNVTRLIDPDTMLIYEEESTRVIDMTLDVLGMGPTPVKVTETRVYEFQY